MVHLGLFMNFGSCILMSTKALQAIDCITTLTLSLIFRTNQYLGHRETLLPRPPDFFVYKFYQITAVWVFIQHRTLLGTRLVFF